MRDPDFHFVRCIRADLERFRAVILAQPAPASGWPLWRGLFSPRFGPVLLCRIAYAFNSTHLSFVGRVVSLVNFVIFGIEIASGSRIAPGLVLPHTQGTVIGAFSIGANATIFHGVTLGARELDMAFTEQARPAVGAGVVIGAGAKILGGVRLGDRCRVGANAVVLESIPDGAVAVGVPARVISSSRA